MNLIVISLPHFFNSEELYINALFNSGLQTMHLRKPFATQEQLQNLLDKIEPKYYNRIVIHDLFSLVIPYNLKGIHLNSRNNIVPQSLSKQNNLHISSSCHSLLEVQQYKYKMNYVFLSPIFDSVSKPGYNSAFTEANLKAAFQSKIIDNKVVALGGITSKNVAKAKELGFSSVAILGDVWNFIDKNGIDSVVSYINSIKLV